MASLSTSLRSGQSYVCARCASHLRHAARPRHFSSRAVGALATGATSSKPQSTRRNGVSPKFQTPRNLAGLTPSTRNYVSDSSPQLPSAPAPKGIVPLPQRRLLRLEGPDAAQFLQGLITNNVDPERTTPYYAAFLNAKGRLKWDVFIWPLSKVTKAQIWGCYIEIDASKLEDLQVYLKQHKLRKKIKTTVVPEKDLSIWAGWRDAEGFVPLFEGKPVDSLVAAAPDPRGINFSERFLFTGSCDDIEAKQSLVTVLDIQQYHLRRYLHGIAEGPQELQQEATLPMEANIDLNRGIDFKKGCYVGQELTIRTKHTGVVRRRIVPIQLYPKGRLPPAQDKLAEYNPFWTKHVDPPLPVKKITHKTRRSPYGELLSIMANVGLASAKLDDMTNLKFGDSRPETEIGEFGVPTGNEVNGEPEFIKIRALVPEWLNKREKEVWGMWTRIPPT